MIYRSLKTHHKHKRDVPSGTALHLAQLINTNRTDAIQPQSLRAGGIIGDHVVLFADEYERLELKHQAHSRCCFAKGALIAAQFLAQQPPGKYSMQAVMNFLQNNEGRT